MLLLELLVLLVQGVDTVDHGLDQLDLRVAKTVLVGDVVGDARLAARLTTGSPGLQVELLAALLQGRKALLGPPGQVNVHRGPHASAEVGGAGVEVAIPGVEHEVLARLSLHRVLHCLDATCQPVKDTADVSSLLHGDDAQLILLIDPDKEALGIIVVDAPALWPVALHASSNQVLVSRHEEEVVINKLLAGLLLHAKERVVVAGEVTLQLGKCMLHQVLDIQPLLLGDARRKTESFNAAANADPCGLDRCTGVNVALDVANIHVRAVLEVLAQAMVLQDQGVKHLSKVLVRVSISSIDATVLVVKLDSTGNGLKNKKSKKLLW